MRERQACCGGVDSTISRLLHASNRPAAAPRTVPPNGSDALTAEEQGIVDSAEQYLADGVALLRWWEAAEAGAGFTERFELQRAFNRAATSYGFFGSIDRRGRTLPLMGNVQEMMYDNPRVPAELGAQVTGWIRDQVREFVLRYFMRISDFRQPESAGTYANPSPPPGLGRLSWCGRNDILREGFGFTQLFYKLRATGTVGRFTEQQSTAIVDLRELGRTYDWIIAKVRIFDFDVTFRPFGDSGPELVFTLNEESYLVLSRDLVSDRDDPEPGVRGDYAVGYAFVKTPRAGFLAYGPGRFDAAVEVIRFRVLESGQVRVHMVFVANRPGSIASVSIDPVDWSLWTADWLSGGAASRALRPIRDVLDRRPVRLGTIDPIYSYVTLANALTGGQAARQLCISREALDKQFLVQHFKQHYQTLVGSLLTWRQIPDWTDEASLPEWVITGASA
jgi:hypothetical protein